MPIGLAPVPLCVPVCLLISAPQYSHRFAVLVSPQQIFFGLRSVSSCSMAAHRQPVTGAVIPLSDRLLFILYGANAAD